MARTVRRPPLLAPGANIRIVNPAWPSMSYAPQRVQRAERALRAMGFEVSYGEHAFDITDDGRSAGIAEHRAGDFMAAFTDPGVDAVMSAGGGATSWELLPLLDAPAIRRNPKPFLGHCENVWLHQYLLYEADLVSYYGAAFMAECGEVGGMFAETAASLYRAVTFEGTLSYQPVPDRTNEYFPWMDPQIEATPRTRSIEGGWHWLAEGLGKGQFVGGEMAYLLRCLDRFTPDLAGTVLFWHVMPNNPAPVASLLKDLADRVDLTALAGMVVGTDPRHEPAEWANLVATTLADVVGPVDYPVLANADIGHTDPVWVLPYGADVVLESGVGLHFAPAAR
ncbi:LD-carboxypeptidase [Phytohabitans suffuscus]|uniref:LD-carboxypeptidase n=1 Tax=Phytohabitans suffuscus TaxID=624315 RepID=A0A6F8YRN7_9ACTN|nr:LD-carboxypeptidase [Phytohabitans suffuscus]BCB88653.1 LD-carboxypeptidase [Phytohabitans suffuscus]